MNALSKTTKQTPGAKHRIRKQQTRLPTKDITQLAIERLKRCQSKEVGRGDPARQVQRLQVGTNLSITGYDDCLVSRRQEDLETGQKRQRID